MSYISSVHAFERLQQTQIIYKIQEQTHGYLVEDQLEYGGTEY